MRDIETVKADVITSLRAVGSSPKSYNGVIEVIEWCQTWRELWLVTEPLSIDLLQGNSLVGPLDTLNTEIWQNAGRPRV